MQTENQRRLCDLLPRYGMIEESLPEGHIGCEEIGADCSEEVKGEISDDEENNDYSHCTDDRTDGVFS